MLVIPYYEYFQGRRMAGSGASYAGSFPNVAGLGKQYGEQAAKQLDYACAQLHNVGAAPAADRVARIDAQVGKADFPILAILANPERAADDVEEALQRPLRRLHARRNGFALLPLLLTWLVVGLLGLQHPSQGTQLLWAKDFGLPIPLFSLVALLDFALLVWVLILTIRVQRAEASAAKTEGHVLNALFTAMDTLEVAVKESPLKAPNSAQEWAEASQQWAKAVERIVESAMEATRHLAQTSQAALAQGTAELAGIQQQGRKYLEDYSAEVRGTLEAVRRDNEQFINRTATEARQTLQRLVEVQMEPLIKQLTGMLAEFGRHQETYRSGVAGLTLSVTGIRDAARELAGSAQAYDRTADTLAKSLVGIEAAQNDYAKHVASSAGSLATAATAMSGFEGSMSAMRDSNQKLAADVTKVAGQVQRSVTDVRDVVRQMAGDVTSASTDLDKVQRRLAGTSNSLTGTSGSLDATTKSLKETTAALDKLATELRRAGGSGSKGTGSGPGRRRKLFWPPSWFGR
jgi:ABC-type transporter Mla subunit MlaD